MDLTGLRIKIDSTGAAAAKQELVVSFEGIERAAKDTEDQVKETSAEFGKMGEAALGLKEILIGLGVAFSFEHLVDTMRDFQMIHSTLDAVTGSVEAGTREFEFMRAEVDRLGLPLMSTGQQYASFLAAVNNTPLEGQKAREVFSGLAEALSALHMPADRAQRALIAVQEIASMGTVTAAHLTRQLAIDIPGAAGLMAKGLGVTTQQLHEMMKAGDLTATVALPAMAKAMHETFGKVSEQTAQMTQGLRNQMSTAIADIEKLIIDSGFEKGFDTAMQKMLAAMRSDEFKKLATEIGQSLGRTMETLGGVVQFVVDHFDALVQVVKIILAFKLAIWFTELVTSVRAATAAMIAFDLTNPVGWLTILAGLTFYAFTNLANDLDRGAASLKEYNDQFKAFIQEKEAFDQSGGFDPASGMPLAVPQKPTMNAQMQRDMLSGKLEMGLDGQLKDNPFFANRKTDDDFLARHAKGGPADQEMSAKLLRQMQTDIKQLETLSTQMTEAAGTSLDKINAKYDAHLKHVQAIFAQFPQLREQYGAIEVQIDLAKHAEIEKAYQHEADFLASAQANAVDKINLKWDEHEKKVVDILGVKIPAASQLWGKMEVERMKELDAYADKTMATINAEIAALDEATGKSKAILDSLTGANNMRGSTDAHLKNTKLVPFASNLNPFQQKVKELQADGLRLDDIFTQWAVNMTSGSVKVTDAFKQMGQSIIAQLTAIIAKMLIWYLLQKLLGGATTSIGGGPSKLGGGGGDLAPVPDLNVPGGGGGVGDLGGLFPQRYGGVMTQWGPAPLARYLGGGVARSRQLAMFGEGDDAEAFVPLPDGKSIPVTVRGGSAPDSSAVPPNVRVLVVNQGTSQQQKGQQVTRWDPHLKEMVVQIYMDDLSNNGPIRRSK